MACIAAGIALLSYGGVVIPVIGMLVGMALLHSALVDLQKEVSLNSFHKSTTALTSASCAVFVSQDMQQNDAGGASSPGVELTGC